MTKIVGCNIGPGRIETLTARMSGKTKELKNHIMEDFILHRQGKKLSAVSYAAIIRRYDQKIKSFYISNGTIRIVINENSCE